MILEKNHIGLGAYLEQIGGRNSGSTSHRSVTPTPSRTITQAKESDPWGHFIVPFAKGGYGIVFTDGVQNWNVVMDSTDSVEDAVKWFLSTYYKYSLLPQQNENGTYVQESYGPRISTSSRSYSTRSGLGRNLFQKFTDAIGLTDHKGDEIFDAEFQATQYRINADQADYNLAMSQGLLLTLSEVLLSFNLAGKFFLLPYGYYYIGDAVKTGAYYNLDAAKETAEQSGQGRYLLQQEELEEFVDGKSEDEPAVKTSMSTKQKLLYALMALGTILYFTIDGDTKKKRKR